MSRSCKSIATDRTFATAFFGGIARGKVVQIHMGPANLSFPVLALQVRDEDSGVVETLEDWLRGECANASMILFDDGAAEPKVASVPIEIITF